MYRIEDRISAIKEVQRLLRLNQTGIYDSATRNAVLKAQNDNSIEETGTVDYDTFEAIVREYRMKRAASATPGYLFTAKYPYVLNDMDENVEIINNALITVLKNYVYEGIIPSGRFLGKSTVDGSNFMRKIFGMPLSDEIDEAFVNRLLHEKKGIEIKTKYGL